MADLGRLLVIVGLFIAFVGVILILAARYLPWLGNLPGDIRYESENVKIYFPLVTMLLISILGTVLLNIILRIFRR